MRKPLGRKFVAAAVAAALMGPALIHASTAAAQDRDATGPMMEAVVTVTKVDPQTRTVTVRGPRGETLVQVPPDSRVDLAQLLPGSRYRVHYREPVAVAVVAASEPSSAVGATAVVEPKPDAKGAAGTRMEEIVGAVVNLDPASRRITVRTPEGRVESMRVAEKVPLEKLRPGETVRIAFAQPIVSQMVSTPQPERDPAPAP